MGTTRLPYLVRGRGGSEPGGRILAPLPRPLAAPRWRRGAEGARRVAAPAKVCCHRAVEWPDDPEIVERAPVRDGRRRRAAVDLVLDRAREKRSQFVFTRLAVATSSSGSRRARPARPSPTSRPDGACRGPPTGDRRRRPERYARTFGHQQTTTMRCPLPAVTMRSPLRPHGDGGRAEVAHRSRVNEDVPEAAPPAGRARRSPRRRSRRRGPLLRRLQARPGRPAVIALAH